MKKIVIAAALLALTACETKAPAPQPTRSPTPHATDCSDKPGSKDCK